jgi:hypothetical protein
MASENFELSGDPTMLWLLRKIFGTVALAWLALWLLVLIASLVAPKVAETALFDILFLNYLGVPASIIWAVLKVISVLGAPRVDRTIGPVAEHPMGQVSTGLAGAAMAPAAAPPDTVSSTVPSAPEVYTYSAPGIPMCPDCGQRPAIFYCSRHRRGVCLACVAKHDEPEECVYIPAFRAPRPRAGQPTTSEPEKPPSAGKPGSVLGID